jgi:hypothetical protein
VCVVDDAALPVKQLVDLFCVVEDLLQIYVEFADRGECGELPAADDIYKESQDDDDGQTDK